MKKLSLLFLLLAWMLTASAGDGHFWLKLQNKSVKMDEAVSHFGEWLSLPSGSTFELLKDETDELGIRHLRYRQFVDGVEVQASMVLVHGRDGMVTSANGVVMEGSERLASSRRVSTTQNDQQKLYLVKTSDGYRYATLQYDFLTNSDAYVDYETGEVLKSLPHRFDAEKTIQGRSLYSGTVPLFVTELADGQRITTDSIRHIYSVDATNAPFIDLEEYFLYKDEQGDDVYDRLKYINDYCPPFSTKSDFLSMSQLVQVTLDKVTPQSDPFAEVYLVLKDSILNIAATSSRVFVSALPLQFDIDTSGGMAAFLNKRHFSIETWLYQYNGDDILLDCAELAPQPLGQNSWKAEKTEGHLSVVAAANPVVDIHWGMQQTYDWYKNTFGRDSYDGKGGPINNIFFAPDSNNKFIGMASTGQTNAFAEYNKKFNCWVMEYGIGDGITIRPVVALDIMAHEFTHLVTMSTAALEYIGESGALNESFSDIFGITIKKAVKGSKAKDNWLIGDDVMINAPCIRDMSHKLMGLYTTMPPNYYKGDDWDDAADVHINSGVQNYWFYLVCEDDMDIDSAIKIVYRNLTQYLTPTSNYIDARKGSLQAAADLFGGPDDPWGASPEYYSVKKAWKTVGVLDNVSPTDIKSVTHTTESTGIDNYWYNLQGQRIEGKPSKTGVYIHHGRKVVIK